MDKYITQMPGHPLMPTVEKKYTDLGRQRIKDLKRSWARDRQREHDPLKDLADMRLLGIELMEEMEDEIREIIKDPGFLLFEVLDHG